MKSLATRLMLIAFLCYQCNGQSPQQHLAYAVDASIARMEALSQRFEEMGNQLNTKVEEMGTQMNSKFEEMGNQLNTKVEEMGTQMNIKFEELHDRMTTMEEMGNQLNTKVEELHDRMTTMEGQLTELQGSSKQETTDIQRLEQSIQGCSSREQVSDFQSIFTDECVDGTHNCSTVASCENTILHYQCSCPPGYLGDGFTCEDVDECSTASANRCHSQATCTNTAGNYTCSCIPGFSGDGFNCEDIDECSTASANRCHSQATCTNTAGNYTCSCIPGFSGDGFNCEDVDECSLGSIKCHSQAKCDNTEGGYTCVCNAGFTGDGFNCDVPCGPPAKVIGSLGCVIPVKAYMSWEAAKKNCQEEGTRLLEGITTQNELDQLKQHFDTNHDGSGYFIWIGMRRLKWIETGNAIGSSSPLWGSGQPHSGEDCGMVALPNSRPYIGDFACSNERRSLCQKK